LNLPKTRPQMMAELVTEMFDGKNPVRTLDVAARLGRHYHTVKTQLHLAGKRGLLRCVPRKGWLPPAAA
jgi:Mn-dependent DtxR family transcriptional regulator